jgi:hypothetical protein
MRLHPDADIIPNHSLGGLKLRTRLYDVQDLIVGVGMLGKVSFALTGPFVAVYRFADSEIALAVDVRNGQIFRLTAYPGYRGSLFGKLRVGMRVAEAMELDPRLFYNEAEGFICCSGVAGLVIDIPEIDPPPDQVPQMMISAISVYAAEINTLEGQRGKW